MLGNSCCVLLFHKYSYMSHGRFFFTFELACLLTAGWSSHNRPDSVAGQCWRSRLCRGYFELLSNSSWRSAHFIAWFSVLNVLYVNTLLYIITVNNKSLIPYYCWRESYLSYHKLFCTRQLENNNFALMLFSLFISEFQILRSISDSKYIQYFNLVYEVSLSIVLVSL